MPLTISTQPQKRIRGYVAYVPGHVSSRELTTFMITLYVKDKVKIKSSIEEIKLKPSFC